ncbi:MAG: EamA family transporter [Actinomycetota bacterium]|nr:EamA family transporter [Actinomycetota bacterium]
MALIWGSSFLFTELSLRFLPYFGVSFWRTFLGGLAMFALVFLLKLQLPKGTQWFHLWVAGVFMSAIPFSLFSYAQQFTTSSLAAIIGAATPMFTLLAILTIYRTEKVTIVATIGLMVGLIGVAITLGVWEGFGQNDPLAIGALVLATISYGIGGPYIRKFVTPMNLSGTSSAAAQVFTSAITLLPFYLFSGPLITSSPSIESLLSIIALGVLGSGYAYRLFHDVIKAAGSTVASTVTFTNPVVATIWGILLLSEELHWYEPIGGMVVILGAWLAQHKATK